MKREDIQRKSTKKPGGVTGKGFVKGDPRINRNGRPRAFDYIRELAQQIGDEVDPIIKKTNAEIVLRRLMKDDGAKFLEIAYGKTPQPVEIDGNMEITINISDAFMPKIKK